MHGFPQWWWTVPLAGILGLAGCTLVATNQKVSSVQVTPANPTIVVGQKQQFVANVTFSDGAILQSATTAVVWASSNPAVATISSSGLATGLLAGTTTITATFDGVSGSTTLTVTAGDQIKVVVSGSASELAVTFPENRYKFLYIAERLNGSIALDWADATTGEEKPVETFSVFPATEPVWLAVDSGGRFLYVANHGSGNISAFSIDRATGSLIAVPGSPFDPARPAWSIAVEPGGQFLSVTHFGSRDISRFPINQETGALRPVP